MRKQAIRKNMWTGFKVFEGDRDSAPKWQGTTKTAFRFADFWTIGQPDTVSIEELLQDGTVYLATTTTAAALAILLTT